MAEDEDTSMGLTYLHVNQLKTAWQCEHDDLVAEQVINAKLTETIGHLKTEIEDRQGQVDIATARAELGILNSCNPGCPNLLVNAVMEILPRPSIEGLGEEDGFMSLKCCIRGEKWAIVGADPITVDDYIECNISQTKSLDDLSHDLPRGSFHTLSELGLTTSASTELLKFASFNELDLAHTSEDDQQEMLNTTYILPVYNRCMWIAQPPQLAKGPHVVTVADQQALVEAENELKMEEFEQKLKRDVHANLHSVASLLSGPWFAILETAAQLAMASWVQRMQAAGDVGNRLSQVLSSAAFNHLYNRNMLCGDCTVGEAEAVLSTLSAATQAALHAEDRPLDLALYLVAAGKVREEGDTVTVIHCGGEGFSVWELARERALGAIAAKAAISLQPQLYAQVGSKGLRRGRRSASCVPEVDFVAMESGSGAPATALGLPLFGFTTLSADGSVSAAPLDSMGFPTHSNKSGSSECAPIVAASLVFRWEDDLPAGGSSSGNGNTSSRRDHVFARMETESLARAARAVGVILQAWLGRHQRVFNPLRNAALSAAAGRSGGGRPSDLLTEGGGRPSVGTAVMSALREVLDEQVMEKERLLKQCLPAVARCMETDWCVVFEVVYTNGAPLVRVYDPSSGADTDPRGVQGNPGEEQKRGSSDNAGKPLVELPSLLQGGLLNFAHWLMSSPGVAPAMGETASHFISAARVETSLHAGDDGLANLLPYDYCGGLEAAQRRRLQLLPHLPDGGTPVYGARVDCYDNTDIKSSASLSTEAGTEEYKGEVSARLGLREEEKNSRSLVILAGNLGAPLRLSTMLQRMTEFISLLETMAAIKDTQVVLSQYSSFHSQFDLISQRVASGAQVHAAQLALHSNLREIEGTLDGSGPLTLQSTVRDFLSSIYAAVSREVEVEESSSLTSTSTPSAGGTSSSPADSINLAAHTFKEHSVIVYVRENLASGQARWWRASSTDSEREGAGSCGGWEPMAPYTADEMVYANSGLAISGAWQERVLYSYQLTKSKTDKVEEGATPQVAVYVGWRGNAAQGRLLDLENYLVTQVKAFMRSHHADLLGFPASDSPVTRTAIANGVGPTVMEVGSHLTLNGSSSRASASAFSRPDFVLGSTAVCEVLATALPAFSVIPIALEFEAVKTTFTEQLSDQTHVVFRLCADKSPDDLYAPADQATLPPVYDTRNALTLGLGEKSSCLPNVLGKPISAIAASMLPPPFPPLPRDRSEKDDAKREVMRDAHCDIVITAEPAHQNELFALLHADSGKYLLRYLASPPDAAASETAEGGEPQTQGQGQSSLSLQPLRSVEEVHRATKGVASDSRVFLSLAGPPQVHSTTALQAAQRALFSAPEGETYRTPSFVLTGYLAVTRCNQATRGSGAEILHPQTSPSSHFIDPNLFRRLQSTLFEASRAAFSAAKDSSSGKSPIISLDEHGSDSDDLGLLDATARALSDASAGADEGGDGGGLAMSVVNGTLLDWQKNALRLLNEAFTNTHNENCHVCRSSSYILDSVPSESGISRRRMVLKQSTDARNRQFAPSDDSGASKELLIVEKTLAGAAHVPTCRVSGYVSHDSSSAADKGEARILVESCVAPEQALSQALTLMPADQSSIQSHKTDYHRSRPPSNFVRISVVAPEAYVDARLMESLQRNREEERGNGSIDEQKKVVLASLLLWFDGYSLEVPGHVMSSLLSLSRRAAYILAANYLQHCVFTYQRACLEAKLSNAADRHQTAFTTHSGIHAAITKLLDVTSTEAGEEYDDDVRVTAEVMGLTRLASTMTKLEDNFADVAAAAINEDVEPVARPLSPQEASWLRGNLQGVTVVTSALATALRNLSDEKRNGIEARRKLAELQVKLKEEKSQAMAFTHMADRLLLGTDKPEHTRNLSPSRTSGSDRSSPQWLVYDNDKFHRLGVVLQATSAFNNRVLALASSQSLREDASQLALGVVSQIGLHGEHHHALLEDVPEGTLRAVTSLLNMEICVWTDGRAPPETMPAVLNLLRPDLLLVAWQKGIKVRGPLHANHHHAFGLMDAWGDVTDGSGTVAQVIVEYVPVMASSFHHHHHESNRAHFHASDWNVAGSGGHGHQHGGEHLYSRHGSESQRSALVAAFPIAIVQHVTLLGKDEKEEGKTMKGDEIVTDGDDMGANSGLSGALDVNANTGNEDLRKWLTQLLSHMQRPLTVEGIPMRSHSVLEAAAFQSLLKEAGKATQDGLAMRMMLDGINSTGYGRHASATLDAQTADEEMREIINIHSADDWTPFCKAAATYAAVRLRSTSTFFLPHLASAGWYGEEDDDESETESDSSESETGSSGHSSGVSSDEEDGEREQEQGSADGREGASLSASSSKRSDTSDSSSTSDDDSAFLRKQRKHDRDHLLNVTGCRARYSKALTREDKDAMKDVESFYDTNAHESSLGAGAAGTGETTDDSLVLMGRKKISDLCFAAQKEGRKRTFENNTISVFGPVEARKLFHEQEGAHHVMVLSFLCDPVERDREDHGHSQGSAAVHQKFLSGIRKLRWVILLQCDRIVGDTEIGLLHGYASTMKTLIYHRTMLTIQATIHAHMGSMDALLESRINHSQQMETIWRFTDRLHEAVRVVHQDTSAALRRMSMMISDALPAVVGALQCDLISSDSVLDDKDGEEDEEEDSHHHTGHRLRKHRKRHPEHHKHVDYARECVMRDRIIMQRVSHSSRRSKDVNHAPAWTFGAGADFQSLDDVGDAEADDATNAKYMRRGPRKDKKRKQALAAKSVYYWVPVFKARLAHVGPPLMGMNKNSADPTSSAPLVDEEKRSSVAEEHVYWSVRLLVDETSPLGCALRKVAMTDLVAANTLNHISSNIRSEDWEGPSSHADDGRQVHTVADVEYSESTDNVPYQNLCFVSKEIRSNLNIIALERSAANVERYTKLHNKLQIVSQAGLAGAEELLNSEANDFGHSALPSVAQLARGMALGMYNANNDSTMRSEHHHHHSSSTEDSPEQSYDRVLATMRACQCSVVGRLHWVTDVLPSSFVSRAGREEGREEDRDGDDAGAGKTDNAVSGDIVGEHSGVRMRTRTEETTWTDPLGGAGALPSLRRRWVMTVGDFGKLQDTIEEERKLSRIGSDSKTVAFDDESVERRKTHEDEDTSCEAPSRDATSDARLRAEARTDEMDFRAADDSASRLKRMLDQQLHGRLGPHNAPSAEYRLPYVVKSDLNADVIDTVMHRGRGRGKSKRRDAGSADGSGSVNNRSHSLESANGVHAHMVLGTIESHGCIPAILKYQQHMHHAHHHSHATNLARQYTGFGLEIGAHLDEQDKDSQYAHDHLVATVYVDVSAGSRNAVLELKVSFCPHSLYPLNHAGAHEPGEHIYAFLRRCVTHVLLNGPITSLAKVVSNNIRSVESTRAIASLSNALYASYNLSRHSLHVLTACLRELCKDDDHHDVADDDAIAREAASAQGLDSFVLHAGSDSGKPKGKAGVGGESNPLNIAPEESINQKSRTVHFVFNSILDRVLLHLLQLDNCLGVSATARDTQRDNLSLYSKVAEVSSEGVPCVSAVAVGRFNSEYERREKFKHLGATSEFSYECGELSGDVTFYWKSSKVHMDTLAAAAVSTRGGDFVEMLDEEKQAQERDQSRLIAHFVQALSRRLYELLRGGRLQQIMVVQQRSLVNTKARNVTLEQEYEKAATAQAHLLTETQTLEAKNKELVHQLRIEKQVNIEALESNRAMATKVETITQSVRNEHEREMRLMKNVYDKEKELLELDLGQREAVIKLMREGKAIPQEMLPSHVL